MGRQVGEGAIEEQLTLAAEEVIVEYLGVQEQMLVNVVAGQLESTWGFCQG